MLIAAEEQGERLSEEECINLVFNVLAGGVDTTQSQLAHAIRLLAGTPSSGSCSASDPALAGAAVEEALRFEPITPFTARILTEEVVFRDVIFPEGTIVLVCAFTGNRDLGEDERGPEAPTSSTSPHPAAAPARSPSARASTTASAQTSRASSSRRPSPSSPGTCASWSSTASPVRHHLRHLRARRATPPPHPLSACGAPSGRAGPHADASQRPSGHQSRRHDRPSPPQRLRHRPPQLLTQRPPMWQSTGKGGRLGPVNDHGQERC